MNEYIKQLEEVGLTDEQLYTLIKHSNLPDDDEAFTNKSLFITNLGLFYITMNKIEDLNNEQ